MEVQMLYSLIYMMKMGPVYTDKRANKIHIMITQARVVHDFLIVEAL